MTKTWRQILIGVAIIIISSGILASGKCLIETSVHAEKIQTLKELAIDIRSELRGLRADLKESKTCN